MKSKLVVALMALLVGGCAVNSTLVPTGGSRADGTVKLSYDYGSLQVPKVDYEAGLASAKARCAAWGYTGAEPFGGGTRTCIGASLGGCNQFRHTVEYQCTGNPPPRS